MNNMLRESIEENFVVEDCNKEIVAMLLDNKFKR